MSSCEFTPEEIASGEYPFPCHNKRGCGGAFCWRVKEVAMRPRIWTLWCRPEGPKISFQEDIAGTWLVMESLNPERKIEWRMSATELLKFGLTCVHKALWR